MAIFCVIVILDVDVQPLAPVTITVYVPGEVIDADALNLLATNPELLKIIRKRLWSTVLTPHPGEIARILKTTV